MSEFRNIETLTSWDKNPRNIKEQDYQKLKDQITLLGQYKPLLVMPDGVVLGGNMRLRAFKELGFTDIWVSIVDFIERESLWYAIVNGKEATKPFTTKLQGMTEYALSDNDRAGYYDQDMLANLMGEVDIDLSAYHVDLGEPVTIEDLLGGDDVKEDEAPAVDNENDPISKLGEVYQLGRHRLMCGDATKMEDVEKLMNGQKADMILTDPPYGVDFERGKFIGREKQANGEVYAPILNDELKGDKLKDLIRLALVNAFSISKSCALYVWSPPLNEGFAILQAIQEAGFKIQSQIVWRKTPFVIGRADYHWQHEICWYGFKEGHEWYGGRDKSTVWDFPKTQISDLHPTMKPIALMANAINNSSKGEDNILDLFGGSGSTLIACEQTDRQCYMMELDPKYCDVIRKRYAKFIGKEEEWQTATPQV